MQEDAAGKREDRSGPLASGRNHEQASAYLFIK